MFFYISLSVTAVYEINICKSASSRRPCSVGIQNRAHLRPAGYGVPGYEEISVFQTPTSVKLIALCSDPTMNTLHATQAILIAISGKGEQVSD